MTRHRQGRTTLRELAAEVWQEDLGQLAREAARRLTGVANQALAATGLGSQQLVLMCLVASARDDSIGALAAEAGVNPSTMSRNLEQLAGAGLVEIVTADDDRRRRAVWLTEKGLLRLQQALPLWREADAALRARLPAGLAAALKRAAGLPAPGSTGELGPRRRSAPSV